MNKKKIQFYTQKVCFGPWANNSFLASGDFCLLPDIQMTFANSLDPDQDRQNVSADLDPSDSVPESMF